MANIWTSPDEDSEEEAQPVIDRETGTGVAHEDFG